ncbi:MAG TPA: Lrp/AsnC family transcriptional regulator [Conexibacter sp.]|nr:Lrp/AsnC family transcriptional regulator [Conexibacter sp.]
MRPHLDEKDHVILEMLRDDARQPATLIARRTGLSSAAVRRRIARLEQLGVIARYTVVVDHGKLDPSVEAYLEVKCVGHADVQELLAKLVKLPAVREASTLAGSPDAMLRLRVRDLDHLREVVTEIRREPGITDSKALVALGRVRHVAQHAGAARRSG